ncbi:hypothetical protein ACN47E_007244 [Coniothyrium glycines]
MATHHVRHPSHHSKKSLPAHARPSRPASLSKRTHSHSGKGSPKIQHHKEFESEDEEDSMAVSFLNYCTVCEKQIITPSNAVLYCSEGCRKRDTEKSLVWSYDYSPPITPFGTFTFDENTFRDIVPQRSPTQPESKRSSCAFSDISFDDMTSSDEKSQHSNSEASRCLRKFQSTTSYSSDTVRPYRTRYNRASASHINFAVAPSLSHTPASSVSFSLPFTPATTRPLPPRTPQSSSYASKSIDLVTPMTAPSSPKMYSYKTPPISRTSTSIIEGEIIYAKSPVVSPSHASGSLGRLLTATQ